MINQCLLFNCQLENGAVFWALPIHAFVHKEHFQKPEFYAYYADYDWVVFCCIFGKMIDLPDGFPMYCKDLKQMLDEKAKNVPVGHDLELGLKSIKMHEDYPNKENEHNALADARWNKKLYEFLSEI